MKAVIPILCLLSVAFVIPVQAQTTSEFGFQIHPEKLLENTEGIIQVFVTSNELMVPKQIDNLQAISSDNEIIEILDIVDGNDQFSKNVLVKAKKPGITSIALAAPGFSSKEISIEVSNNNNHPTQILMKTTPEKFPIDGPKFGYVAIELATTGGLPTIAPEDISISLETPNNDVIKLKNSEVVISKGEYYVLTEFEIIGTGDAIIFAETEGMNKISSIVNVLEATKPLQLQLYVYPKYFNSYSATTGYAIVQLIDGEGVPVLAEENIEINLEVENPDISINTSHDFEEITFEKKKLVIEKDSYSDYTKFTPRPNLGEFTDQAEQSYNMFISTDDFLTKGDSFTILHDEIGALEGEGPSVTEVLPFLTSGKQEIIAVTYYETEIEVSRQTGGSTQGTTNRELVSVTVPVKAKENHEINISSSEIDTVNPINPIMQKGESAVVVFGQTGTVAPEETMELYITDNEGVKTEQANPIGPVENDIELIVEPLIPMILAEKEFPTIAFLEDGSADEAEEVETTTEDDEDEDPRLGATPFIDDAILTFSANEFVDTDSETITKNQPYAVMSMVSKELGTSKLSFQMSGFDGETDIVSHTTDPSEMFLSYPKNILSNSKTSATVQLLDSIGNPVYSKEDMKIKLVSNNEEVVKIPNEIIIEKGEYFTTFELEAINEGKIELALLSENFDLSKYDINVVDVSPILTLDLGGTMNYNERIEAKLSVSIPEITTSLSGFEVEWLVDGGEVRQFDEVTNADGIAIMNVIANDKEQVKITVLVSGNGLSSSELSKTATILNMPIAEVIEDSNEEQVVEQVLPMDTNTLIFIIIPVAVGGTIFFLKRTDRLYTITEKIPIGDKIEEIKEKISDIRDR